LTIVVAICFMAASLIFQSVFAGPFFNLTNSGVNLPSDMSLDQQQYNLTVPTKYQSEYVALQGILNGFNASLGPDTTVVGGVTFATELLPANGNRGPALLEPGNLASVATNLNALQAMGVQGVTIAIGYPLLDPTFPNSAQYLGYFQQVVSMAHARGMKVLVESQILFANTPYSPLTFDWENLPYSQFITNHIAQDQLIINTIRPDYLELGVEADTEAFLTGYSQLNTAAGWTSYIDQLLSSLNKGNTKLVAGAATWLGTSFLTGFANNPRLDFISTHIYPIYGNNLQTLIEMGQIAEQNGKPLVVDEEWEEKVLQPVTGSGSGTGIGGPLVTQQDVFAYWSPIDAEFLNLMAKFAKEYHLVFFSPFSEDYFFAYLDWTPILDSEGYFQLKTQLDPLVSQNMASNALTPTGEDYSTLIHEATITSLGQAIINVFSSTNPLGFEETGNVYDNSGAGFMIAHRAGSKSVFIFTDSTRVNQTTGELLFNSVYSNAVVVGGPAANPTTAFYESHGFTPLTATVSGGSLLFQSAGATVYSVSLASLTSTNDYFLIETFLDSGHTIILAYGINAPGTLASGAYFDNVFGNTNALESSAYIIHWQGTVPSVPLPSDNYTITYHN